MTPGTLRRFPYSDHIVGARNFPAVRHSGRSSRADVENARRDCGSVPIRRPITCQSGARQVKWLASRSYRTVGNHSRSVKRPTSDEAPLASKMEATPAGCVCRADCQRRDRAFEGKCRLLSHREFRFGPLCRDGPPRPFPDCRLRPYDPRASRTPEALHRSDVLGTISATPGPGRTGPRSRGAMVLPGGSSSRPQNDA